MNPSDSFQNLFPVLLENIAQEVGDLIGESFELQDENIYQGSIGNIFSPPKKKFVLTGLNLKENAHDPAHLLVDMDTALDLGGKLIMLPENEISAYRKRGKLDGEILDAFSEIANIIAGVINTTCQEYLPRKKLNFVKGEPEVFAPKATEFPFPESSHTLFSGTLIPENAKPGLFQLFFPHTLLENAEDAKDGTQSEMEDGGDKEDIRNKNGSVEESGVQQPPTDPVTNSNRKPVLAKPPDSLADPEMEPDKGLLEEDNLEKRQPETRSRQEDQGQSPQQDSRTEKFLDPKMVDTFLLESLDPAREEMEALLGSSLQFTDQQNRSCRKKDLLVKTRGKQVLVKIDVSEDREGEAYLLLPLKDAVFIGATLLLMPSEAVTQAIKQGKFDGDVADAFGEVVNILVGCYSNRFRSDFPFKLALRKDTVETLVPSQVDTDSNQVFQGDDYHVVSTRLQMEDKILGPLEIIFPKDILGLAPGGNTENVADTKVIEDTPPASPQNRPAMAEKNGSPVSGAESRSSLSQKIDTSFGPAGSKALTRKVIVLGRDVSQAEVLQEFLVEENIDMSFVSPDNHLKQHLDHGNLCCVFLLLKKINEQGFAEIIKTRAVLNTECPLIVAGPEWTKSKVLKAVQYGATDILVTPAEKKLIHKKCHKYLEAV